ncbi:MAG: ubiquinone/menaquinone biosynthesis methyltransferase [Thermoanaerobaculales bacterium]|nr:ubiquinone/menaquinone biosynthesis methyltransferase [Thermoanaerobaculales bacterium]
MREELRSKRTSEIRRMFGRIARRYDLLNRVLSLGRDRGWRRLLAQRVVATRPRLILDICTGTGDVTLAFDPNLATLGSDFCLPMLVLAKKKAAARRRVLPLFAGDAMHLPLRDGSVDVVTVAFGVRNFQELEIGLVELMRVLVPGGVLLILEFSRPQGLFGPIMRWWVRTVPPRVGRWISGDPEAYRYLPDSVSTFPSGEDMCVLLTKLGLTTVRARALTGGVATLYEGVTPPE